MIRIHAAHYATGTPLEITLDQGTIQNVALASERSSPAKDAGLLQAQFVAPAFFDLQINGCLGHDFSSDDLSIEQMHEVVTECRRHGVAALCPTLITNSFESLRRGFNNLRRAVETDRRLDRAFPVFHLEGPYIAGEDGPRGAHPREHVRPPDWDEFQRWQEVAGGRIRLVTLAPEHEAALPFIEKLNAAGVVVAIGHTAASPARIRAAVAAGARLSTHLGNGCHLMLPRHDNYFWEQLAADELWASVICDGHHLPPALIRCIARVKGPRRLILTCDASPLAGLPPGRYRKWGQELEVLPTGKIVVPGAGVLGGSGLFTDQCVAHAVRLGDLSLKDAVEAASERPRQLLRLPVVALTPGSSPDLVLFDLESDGTLQVRHTVLAGE